MDLINSVWTLLHTHKNLSQKAEYLEEQNHVLERRNKQLNVCTGHFHTDIPSY